MPRPTLSSIENKLDDIIKDVEKKVDKEILVLELEAIKKDISNVQIEQARVNSYGRWVIILIATALITALLNLIIKSA